MRPHIRKTLHDGERVQPNPGEPYIMCRHVDGSPETGFSNTHVLRVFDEVTRLPLTHRGDVMGKTIPPSWFFLCDQCYRRHESGEDDGQIVGTDGVWPTHGRQITYTEHA